MMTVYEACDRVGLPILFHLDDIRGIDTPGLPRLENVLKSFPEPAARSATPRASGRRSPATPRPTTSTAT